MTLSYSSSALRAFVPSELALTRSYAEPYVILGYRIPNQLGRAAELEDTRNTRHRNIFADQLLPSPVINLSLRRFVDSFLLFLPFALFGLDDILIFKNIQIDTFDAVTQRQHLRKSHICDHINIPVRISYNGATRNGNRSPRPLIAKKSCLELPPRNIGSPARSNTTKSLMHGPSLILANTMFLAPKIDEVRSVMLDSKSDLGFFTETWLRDSIPADHIKIPEYNFTQRNRMTDFHGGVGLYIENSIRFKCLDHLQDPTLEVLWVWLRPTRLPQGIPCIVAGTIYNLHFNDSATDSILLNYLCESLTSIEEIYPGCGFLLCGDLNRSDIRRLLSLTLRRLSTNQREATRS